MNRHRTSHVLFFPVVLSLLFFLSGCSHTKIAAPAPVYATGSVRDQIVQVAHSVLGQPYRFGGKGPENFDCSGLVVFAYEGGGVSVPPPTENMMKLGDEIDSRLVLPGDLVFFSIGKEYHVGIVVNRFAFIHASKSRGVAVDRLDSPYWKKRTLSFRRLL